MVQVLGHLEIKCPFSKQLSQKILDLVASVDLSKLLDEVWYLFISSSPKSLVIILEELKVELKVEFEVLLLLLGFGVFCVLTMSLYDL